MRFGAWAGAGLAILTLLVVLLPATARAQQSVSADILGTVTDQSGAVIPGAQITVKNVGTGVTSTAKSDDRGEYLVQFLIIGTYEVTVDAKGFKKYLAKDITLTAGDRARVDAKMTLGAASETVTVSEVAAPALEADTSTISTEIPATNIADVPLSGRNLTDLVLMTAGVESPTENSKLDTGCQSTRQDGGQGAIQDCRPSSGYVVNGESDLNQNNTLDGMDNNDRAMGTIEVKPSIDAIEEVKVQTSLYSAESGRTAGGLVQIVTKSGSNTFKGSLYEYIRNDAFDANTTWNTTKDMLRQNQFGASLGGPIFKNRTFFFADYEGMRIHSRQQTGQGSEVPWPQLTSDVETGDAGKVNADLLALGVGFGNLTSADTIPQVVKNLFLLYPAPDDPNCSTLTGCVYKSAPTRAQNSDTADIRIDQHINDRNTLYGRYSYNMTTTVNGPTYPSTTVNGHTFTMGGVNAQQPEDNISLDYTHIYKPNLILDLKAGYTYGKQAYLPSDDANAASDIGFNCGANSACPPSGPTNGYFVGGLPTISGLTVTTSGGGGPGGPPGGGGGAWSIGETNFAPYLARDHTHQYNASLTWTKGAENIKFGIAFIDRKLYSEPMENSPYGQYTFTSDSSTVPAGQRMSATDYFMLGEVTSKARSYYPFMQHLTSYEPAMYVQDDWRAMPKLTLNLGVRWDAYTPYTEENGYLSNFDPSVNVTNNGVSYVGAIVSPDLLGAQHSDKYANIKAHWRDVAPRIGFAYTVPWNTVFRGGFGMTYYPSAEGPGTTSLNVPFDQNFSCTSQANGTQYGTASTACSNITSALVDGMPPPGVTDVNTMLSEATNPALYASESGAMGFSSINPNLHVSYLYQYSLQAQKEWRSNIMTVGYVGNIGRRIATTQNLNVSVNSQDAANPEKNFGLPFPDLTQYTCGTPGDTNCGPGGNLNDLAGISYPGLVQIEDVFSSFYNAMQATFLRRSANGLTTSINYTYAHQMNNGLTMNESGNQNSSCTSTNCIVDDGKGGSTIMKQTTYDWGNGDLDLRHRISGVLTYQLPVARNAHGIVHAVAGGWTGNLMGVWQTGQHYTISPNGVGGGGGPGGGGPATPGASCYLPSKIVSDGWNSNLPPNGGWNDQQPSWCMTNWSGIYTDVRPNIVPGCNPTKNTATFKRSLNEWFNTDCVELQQYGMFGDQRRNQYPGPIMERADISMNKTFDLHENYKLQLRMEGFNITNTPSYGITGAFSATGCDSFDPSYATDDFGHFGNSCGYLSEAWKWANSTQPLLASNNRANAAQACESGRSGGANGGGPGQTDTPGCVTGLQTNNREFQFAVRLTF
jgi:hypothetical protein